VAIDCDVSFRFDAFRCAGGSIGCFRTGGDGVMRC